MKQCVLFEELKDLNAVKCTACAHYCVIAGNRSGLCGVRKNINGKLFLLVYGRAAAVNIDPIEKKPFFHFLPGTKILSIGTLGCNFGCEFCQNWDISQAARNVSHYKEMPGYIKIGKIEEFGQKLEPEKIAEYCFEHNIPSIAFTYNEPSILFEYAYDTAKQAKKLGIKTVFVSNGYESKEALKKLVRVLSAFNIDLKAFSNESYLKIMHAKLDPVLETIKRIAKSSTWLEITTLVVPGMNDSDKELKSIAGFIAKQGKNIPWHVTAFHPDYKMQDVKRTSLDLLLKAHAIGKNAGLKFVYTGNIAGLEQESTFCPDCSKNLLKRTGYFVENTVFFEKGKCLNCNTVIPGVWS